MKTLQILLSLILVIGCQFKKNNDEGQETNKVTNQIPFPHPKNFKDINQHGFMFLTDQGSFCKNCHGSDLKGEDKASSCFLCHPSYPHNWDKTNNPHGKMAETDQESCQKCHNATEHQKSSKEITDKSAPKCVTCHQYPHEKTWTNPETDNFHGNIFIKLLNNAKQKEVCLTCHNGSNNNIPSCKTCHKQFPHTSDFKSTHNQKLFGLPFLDIEQNCLTCHNLNSNKDDLKFPQESCLTCHSYPHNKSKWLDKNSSDFHGTAFQKSSTGDCQKCHGASLGGNSENDRKSCFTCHNNFPHIESDWLNAHKNNFINELSSNPAKETKCMNCHGSKYEGTTTTPACSSCHKEIPHTWQRNPITRAHGEQYVRELNTDNISCTKCHGSKLEGGQVAPACEKCHKYYPHPRPEIPPRYPFIQHTTPMIEKNSCKVCHSGNMKEWVRPNDTQKNCAECHEQWLNNMEKI